MNKSKLDILIESEVKPSELTQEQIKWLNNCMLYGATWRYENGVINVEGDCDCSWKKLASIPIQFGEIDGMFFISHNSLTSLKGCPTSIREDFECCDNKLTSLEYMPTKIGGKCLIYYNQFILNDKLFEDLAGIGGKKKILEWPKTRKELYDSVKHQFGLTRYLYIDKIWKSYMNILEGKNNE